MARTPGPAASPVAILKKRQSPLLLVVGDLMLDRYVWGEVSRISPEAPIQILHVQREEEKLGGAANVVRNVVALGGRVVPCGVVGKDVAGRFIRNRLARLARTRDGIVVDPTRPTIEKTRMVAQAQQVLRVDREKRDRMPHAVESRVVRFIRKWIPRVDGVILSDYGKGLLTEAVLRAAVDAARRAGVPVLVDPKGKDYSRYRGATAITPNRLEAQEGSGMTLDGRAAIHRAARHFRGKMRFDTVFITLGSEGIAYLDPKGALEILPAKARSVYDVTGAGDTVISMLGVALALGADHRTGAILANLAAGIVVGKLGAATATREEVLAALGELEHHPKVLSRAKLREEIASRRAQGRKVVFTNGCFDILHVGHARLLEEARHAGDLLVVGVNGDASVRRLKGPGRPVVPQAERAALLASLACVDYVAIFDEDVPERLIRAVRPDILIKGEDWREKGVVGRRFVESYGGRVELIRLVPGRSTTNVIARIRGAEKSKTESSKS